MPSPGAPYLNIGDLITNTLNQLPKTYSDTMRQTKYPLCQLFFSQLRRSLDGGQGYEKKVRKTAKTTFQFVRPYQATSTRHEDLTVKQVTTWVFGEQKMEFDERTKEMNSGGPAIIDNMKVERSGAYEDIFNRYEDALGDAPYSASDDLSIWGLPYWAPTLELNTADPTGGFNGKTIYYKDGSSGTTRAGIDLSNADNARLRSFVGTHSGYVDQAFLDLLRRAMTRTDFGTIPQLEGDKPAGSSPSDMFLLASHAKCDDIERRINRSPDPQQGDIERFTEPMFRGVKFIRTPTLENYAYDPVYGIKRSKVYGIVLKDMWMKELKAMNSQATPLTWVVPIVCGVNLTCDDPRSGVFCLHTVRTS